MTTTSNVGTNEPIPQDVLRNTLITHIANMAIGSGLFRDVGTFDKDGTLGIAFYPKVIYADMIPNIDMELEDVCLTYTITEIPNTIDGLRTVSGFLLTEVLSSYIKGGRQIVWKEETQESDTETQGQGLVDGAGNNELPELSEDSEDSESRGVDDSEVDARILHLYENPG